MNNESESRERYSDELAEDSTSFEGLIFLFVQFIIERAIYIKFIGTKIYIDSDIGINLLRRFTFFYKALAFTEPILNTMIISNKTYWEVDFNFFKDEISHITHLFDQKSIIIMSTP